MRFGRWALFALLPIGVVAGHRMAYAVADAANDHAAAPAHGYLNTAGPYLLFYAISLLLLLGATRRGRPLPLPRISVLMGAQIAAFIGQEALERLSAGQSIADTVASPAVRWGIGAQLLVALLVISTVRATRSAISMLVKAATYRATRSGDRDPTIPPAINLNAPTPCPLSSLSRRGPPQFL